MSRGVASLVCSTVTFCKFSNCIATDLLFNLCAADPPAYTVLQYVEWLLGVYSVLQFQGIL